MKFDKNIAFLFYLFAFFTPTKAQNFSVGIKISGIAFHPEPQSYYKRKLDKNGHVVSFHGITLTSDVRITPHIGIKVIQSILPSDCAGKWSFISHVGINIYENIIGWGNDKHNLSGSFGPLFYYRKGWNEVKNYTRNPTFINATKNNKWEYKFVWYGAQIQYDYLFTTNTSLSLNIFPGHPYIYTFATGVNTTF